MTRSESGGGRVGRTLKIEKLFTSEGLEFDAAQRRAWHAGLVHDRWKKAVEHVYGDAAELVLRHTNAVYVMKASDVDLTNARAARLTKKIEDKDVMLLVYSDDSMVRSDLDNRREFLRMKMRELGEMVSDVVIFQSTRDMKKRHPYDEELQAVKKGRDDKGRPVRHKADDVSLQEQEAFSRTLGKIENPALRDMVEKAYNADMRREVE